MSSIQDYDVLVVGASLCGAAAAKRLTDAGVSCAVIEREPLPRHKICSGIISPRGYRFLKEEFGELPDEAFHQPKTCKGVNFLFADGMEMPVDFNEGPTPHIYRKFADHHCIKQSGATIFDEERVLSFQQDESGVDVTSKTRQGEHKQYRSRLLIAADGPYSTIVKQLVPESRQQRVWFMVGQKYYQAKLDLDPQYFHFALDQSTGYYPWTHLENGQHIIGALVKQGDDLWDQQQKLIDYLQKNHGLVLGEEMKKEGTPENLGWSVTNRYEFGQGRVLVAGQAAGFLNMMAEGMSCALHSGAIAGSAALEGLQRAGMASREIENLYRVMIRAETQRTSDQFNILKVIFGRPHEADLKKALRKMGVIKGFRAVAALINFLRHYHGLGWGADIRRMIRDRAVQGHY